ncbi:transcriptional regulator [Salimicrobium jeotgali]|uniref:SinR/xre family transcription regulator n=1 Tax=Salimicrobium jeotgali TaxID=1230341 RepID=K2GIZ1_9BACI|nr:helix-turn-helix transcriptional regulator [Salimicrobium jeotgali]AKG05556.1 transcriptional regulator [Salimicrobium jeotgali]EKE30449.1 SinR/xre family transcription regulator [Salimicrobium jeotgali]MBM7696592.1 transcriptional regulator with XRE-family HTH domain [Salimicrobium jeotgali]
MEATIMADSVLGARLRKLREQHELTQKRAASIFGLTNFQLSRYEKGQTNPDPDLIRKFAEYFEVTTDYLLGRSDDPNQTEDENFDPLEELKQFMIENNMQDMDLGFYDIEKWKQLSREDIEDVKKHFEYVLHRAQERNKKEQGE